MGPAHLAESSSGGHAQDFEVTVRLCSLQTLVRGALGGQTLCDAPLTARTSSMGQGGTRAGWCPSSAFGVSQVSHD